MIFIVSLPFGKELFRIWREKRGWLQNYLLGLSWPHFLQKVVGSKLQFRNFSDFHLYFRPIKLIFLVRFLTQRCNIFLFCNKFFSIVVYTLDGDIQLFAVHNNASFISYYLFIEGLQNLILFIYSTGLEAKLQNKNNGGQIGVYHKI